MLHHHSAFQLEATHGPDAHVICARGELDLFGRLALEIALIEAEQGQAERIVLDLEDLTFVDASGLSVLLNAADSSASNGNRLRITRGKGQVAKMFQLMGLDTRLPFADSAPVAASG